MKLFYMYGSLDDCNYLSHGSHVIKRREHKNYNQTNYKKSWKDPSLFNNSMERVHLPEQCSETSSTSR